MKQNETQNVKIYLCCYLEIEVAKVSNFLFQCTIQENIHLDFHKQFLDMMKFLYDHKMKTI